MGLWNAYKLTGGDIPFSRRSPSCLLIRIAAPIFSFISKKLSVWLKWPWVITIISMLSGLIFYLNKKSHKFFDDLGIPVSTKIYPLWASIGFCAPSVPLFRRTVWSDSVLVDTFFKPSHPWRQRRLNGYRRFALEQKIRFLDLYEKSGVAAAATRHAGIPRKACRRWLKQKERLREDYEYSLVPVEQHDEVRKFKKFSLEEKIECINAFDIGVNAGSRKLICLWWEFSSKLV